jgi:crotonobetainyl-CoA:carnitine CoA-transferase CaiB-like acyl-CoA transferase
VGGHISHRTCSGFGQTGPRRHEAGYDAVIQAEAGLMSITGTPDGPPVRLGVAIADIATGMFAFQGLLLALIARGTTSRGQHVDVSLFDSVAALLTYQASKFFATGDVPVRLGNGHASIAPYDDVFGDPQMAAREMAVTLPHSTIGSLTLLGVPVKLSATPGGIRTPPPRLGEQTAQALREDAGVDATTLEKLAAAGIVRMAR